MKTQAERETHGLALLFSAARSSAQSPPHKGTQGEAAVTLERQRLLLADTAMKCCTTSQTQGDCFICQVLSSSPAASVT